MPNNIQQHRGRFSMLFFSTQNRPLCSFATHRTVPCVVLKKEDGKTKNRGIFLAKKRKWRIYGEL